MYFLLKWTFPVSPCGPNCDNNAIKNPSAQQRLKNIVVNIKTPIFSKNIIAGIVKNDPKKNKMYYVSNTKQI